MTELASFLPVKILEREMHQITLAVHFEDQLVRHFDTKTLEK